MKIEYQTLEGEVFAFNVDLNNLYLVIIYEKDPPNKLKEFVKEVFLGVYKDMYDREPIDVFMLRGDKDEFKSSDGKNENVGNAE